MPSPEQRLADKCAKALISAFDSLAGLLERCDPEAAANIVAGLLKAQMSRPAPEPDTMSGLQQVIDRARREAAQEAAQEATNPDYATAHRT